MSTGCECDSKTHYRTAIAMTGSKRRLRVTKIHKYHYHVQIHPRQHSELAYGIELSNIFTSSVSLTQVRATMTSSL
eukprot:6214378-Pleurochrysis_carterae.AAC.2